MAKQLSQNQIEAALGKTVASPIRERTRVTEREAAPHPYPPRFAYDAVMDGDVLFYLDNKNMPPEFRPITSAPWIPLEGAGLFVHLLITHKLDGGFRTSPEVGAALSGYQNCKSPGLKALFRESLICSLKYHGPFSPELEAHLRAATEAADTPEQRSAENDHGSSLEADDDR